MSEVTDMVKGTVEQVMERIDALAAKLGIAAEQVWKFTVGAKLVEAKRDFALAASLILLTLVFWGWAIHVAVMHIPHEIISRTSTDVTNTPVPCTQFWSDGIKGHPPKPLAATCMTTNERPIEVKQDEGIGASGWIYIISGILFALAGLLVVGMAVSGMIEAVAAVHTAEYDAFQDLLYDLKP